MSLLPSYGWLEIRTYFVPNLDSDYVPGNFFASFLHCPSYEVTLLGSEMEDRIIGVRDIHGPLVLAKIKPNDFVKISQFEFSERVNGIIQEFLEFDAPDYETEDFPRIEEVKWLLASLPNENMDYYVLNIDARDKSYHHETSFILANNFHEFILINTRQQKMYLCFLATD